MFFIVLYKNSLENCDIHHRPLTPLFSSYKIYFRVIFQKKKGNKTKDIPVLFPSVKGQWVPVQKYKVFKFKKLCEWFSPVFGRFIVTSYPIHFTNLHSLSTKSSLPSWFQIDPVTERDISSDRSTGHSVCFINHNPGIWTNRFLTFVNKKQ